MMILGGAELAVTIQQHFIVKIRSLPFEVILEA